MKIEDVLKNEDKAIPVYQEKNRFSNVYASLDDSGILCWYSMESDERLEPVPLAAINEKEWGAYHEVKEIRPEKAGELWRGDLTGTYYHTEIFEQRLVWASGGRRLEIMEDDFQPKSMTRLFPPVEDDSVETIEAYLMKGEYRSHSRRGEVVFNVDEDSFDKLTNHYSGNLKIEIPKDLTKHP